MKSRQLIFRFFAGAILAGLALWYFLAKPAGPLTAPVAQKPIAAPAPVLAATKPANESTPATVAPKRAAPAATALATSPVPVATPVLPQPAAPAASIAPEKKAPAAPAIISPTAAKLSAGEVAASRRMYMAHAPLRAPAVANPDSPENQRIFNTMVKNTLNRAKSDPLKSQPSSLSK